MADRQEHRQAVLDFLQKYFSIAGWSFSLPPGSGREFYFALGNGQGYFVKLGVPVERYLIMAEIGLTPPVLVHGQLDNGLSVVVQPIIAGRTPSRLDYRNQLTEVAECILKMHYSQGAKQMLPRASSNLYRDAGSLALNRLRQKWEHYRAQVPVVAEFVDTSLESLAQQISFFTGEGLVVSHGDICNANWLFTADGTIYLQDFESMSMDDHALDLGALLWWYYPPALRQRFLDIAGVQFDDEVQFRMRVRMAIHCLDITLPREGSFDQFNPNTYGKALRDFKAILKGEENPEGYY